MPEPPARAASLDASTEPARVGGSVGGCDGATDGVGGSEGNAPFGLVGDADCLLLLPTVNLRLPGVVVLAAAEKSSLIVILGGADATSPGFWSLPALLSAPSDSLLRLSSEVTDAADWRRLRPRPPLMSGVVDGGGTDVSPDPPATDAEAEDDDAARDMATAENSGLGSAKVVLSGDGSACELDLLILGRDRVEVLVTADAAVGEGEKFAAREAAARRGRPVSTSGVVLIDGDVAVAKVAIAQGCRWAAIGPAQWVTAVLDVL